MAEDTVVPYAERREIVEEARARTKDPALADMIRDLLEAPDAYQPSMFWAQHLRRHVKQMARHGGLAHFKRKVNQNYFNWIGKDLEEQFDYVAQRLGARAVQNHAVGPLRSLSTRPRDWKLSDWKHYQQYVRMLWDYARRHDRLGLLEGLEEPPLGRPFTTKWQGRRISQDLANSALELNAALEAREPSTLANIHMLELGGGYGRIPYVLLRKYPEARVWVVDIPPALHIAQWYLSSLFEGRRVFRYRPFQDHAEIADELATAQIAFLLPQQLELLPADSVDLFVNVNSLREMTFEQIDLYLAHVDRITHGHFYTKQWIEQNNEADQIHLNREDYPVRPRWAEVYSRECPIQVRFFEALYRVPAVGDTP